MPMMILHFYARVAHLTKTRVARSLEHIYISSGFLSMRALLLRAGGFDETPKHFSPFICFLSGIFPDY